MFAEIKTAAAGAAGVALLVIGLALGLLAGGVAVRAYDAWFTIPDAERAAAERADARWKEDLAKAKEEADRERRKAEDEIAAAERDFIAKDAARASRMTVLEQALEQERADAPIPSPADRPGVCRPAVSRGVRDALQAIGRSGSGAHPAKPDAAVRSGR